ncbi:MAG: DEAD/DEAH box helicase family protein [Bacillota bacterium]
MNYAKYIKNALGLRDPQRDALYVFQEICNTLSLQKDCDLDSELEKITGLYPTLTSFEREFPSFTFALATGIGKTRLMGAMIAYLHYTQGICNFFVVAPSTTIYRKLKDDFGNPASRKYLFRGLDKFVTPPRIVHGENYSYFQQKSLDSSSVTINVFNISKLTSDSKDTKGKVAKIKRMNEYLGEAYFDYLKGLDDLCVFMDESHHYHAEKGFQVINELKPILGVEVTATPQIQTGSKKQLFKNVAYEYSLAHALNDEKYVKVPVVVTRKDFNPDQYTPAELEKEKLNDGIKLHIETQGTLELYAKTYDKKRVKPFVLVVAKDTTHAKEIHNYLTSNDFFGGKYKGKVLEVHSDKKAVEKDDNIDKLLKLESDDNEIEIVIHVNMLKEGWDVNNLYTIIPLRTSASETLTEQTIGRGLRLPYGQRTGVDSVDRLSIVSHDKYADIVKLANDENSLVRKVYIIDPNENPTGEKTEVIEMPPVFNIKISDPVYTNILVDLLPENEMITKERQMEVAQSIAKITGEVVQEINKKTNTFCEVESPEIQNLIRSSVVTRVTREFPNLEVRKEDILPCIEKATEFSIQTLTTKVIPIPVGSVQAVSHVRIRYEKFTLDTTGIHYEPSDETLVATELREGGRTFDIDVVNANIRPNDTPENAIAKFIMAKDNIDYAKASEVIFDVIDQLKKHLFSYLHTEENVERVLREKRKTLAEHLYAQINLHFYKDETQYTVSDMRPFSKIEMLYAEKFESDKIYIYDDDVPPSEIKKKVFTGFEKACHAMYKFDSSTEKTFANILENDASVEKWLCPSIKQFNLYYDRLTGARYQPDFIVETKEMIYMVETKDRRMLQDKVVLAKAKAGTAYCESATAYNLEHGGKPWRYLLIPHDEVRLNSSLKGMVGSRV